MDSEKLHVLVGVAGGIAQTGPEQDNNRDLPTRMDDAVVTIAAGRMIVQASAQTEPFPCYSECCLLLSRSINSFAFDTAARSASSSG